MLRCRVSEVFDVPFPSCGCHMHPTESEYIRPNPSNFFASQPTHPAKHQPLPRPGRTGKEKCNTLRKPLKFNFIALSNTFFLMPGLKVGKETVKFLAVYDHISSPFSQLTPVRSSRFNHLTFQRFNAVFDLGPTLTSDTGIPSLPLK
jgi:hypothetical protein